MEPGFCSCYALEYLSIELDSTGGKRKEGERERGREVEGEREGGRRIERGRE